MLQARSVVDRLRAAIDDLPLDEIRHPDLARLRAEIGKIELPKIDLTALPEDLPIPAVKDAHERQRRTRIVVIGAVGLGALAAGIVAFVPAVRDRVREAVATVTGAARERLDEAQSETAQMMDESTPRADWNPVIAENGRSTGLRENLDPWAESTVDSAEAPSLEQAEVNR
jgi:hypothetical protein